MYILLLHDTSTTEIYTLSLHDALPIWAGTTGTRLHVGGNTTDAACTAWDFARGIHGGVHESREQNPKQCMRRARKSTRLNSSHITTSYAVFCLKKKKRTILLI